MGLFPDRLGDLPKEEKMPTCELAIPSWQIFLSRKHRNDCRGHLWLKTYENLLSRVTEPDPFFSITSESLSTCILNLCNSETRYLKPVASTPIRSRIPIGLVRPPPPSYHVKPLVCLMSAFKANQQEFVGQKIELLRLKIIRR